MIYLTLARERQTAGGHPPPRATLRRLANALRVLTERLVSAHSVDLPPEFFRQPFP